MVFIKVRMLAKEKEWWVNLECRGDEDLDEEKDDEDDDDDDDDVSRDDDDWLPILMNALSNKVAKHVLLNQ